MKSDKPKKKWCTDPEMREARMLTIIELAKAGKRQVDMAEYFGISRQRVQQIIKTLPKEIRNELEKNARRVPPQEVTCKCGNLYTTTRQHGVPVKKYCSTQCVEHPRSPIKKAQNKEKRRLAHIHKYRTSKEFREKANLANKRWRERKMETDPTFLPRIKARMAEYATTYQKKKKVELFLKESNAIEGIVDTQSLDDAREAWEFLLTHDVMTVETILAAHAILMKNQKIDSRYKGALRDVDVYVGNKIMMSPISLKPALEEWCNRTMREFTPSLPIDPRVLHVQFENIHPFVDGNGRIGRMLMNWTFVKRMNKSVFVVHSSGKNNRDYFGWFTKFAPVGEI